MRSKLSVAFIVVILCEIAFFLLEQPMKDAGYGILNQQFAWSESRAETIFQAWKPVQRNVWLFMAVDMVFPAALFWLNFELHSFVETDFGFWKRISLAAMVFDYLENLLTFVMLFGTINQFLSNSVTILAILKFSAIIPALLFGIYRAARNYKNAPAGI